MLKLSWSTILILAATGALMGVLSLFGLYGAPVEFGLWTLLGAAVWAPLLLRTGAPLLNGAVGGLAAGIATGAVQAVGIRTYLANHPEVAGPASAALQMQFLGFAIVVGLVWGALFGGVALGIRKWRARASTSAA